MRNCVYAAYSPDESNNTNVHFTNTSQSNSQNISTDDLVEVHRNSIQRKRARDGLVVQSCAMVQRSRLEQVAGDPGDKVTIPILLVERGKGDPRIIMDIILDRDERELYRIAVRLGILK